MKIIGLIMASAVLSSIITVTIYSIYFPQRILVREPKLTTEQNALSPSLRSALINQQMDRIVEHNTTDFSQFNFREGSKKAIPAVVNIKSTEVRTNRYGYEYLDHSSGSGVIVSSDGYVVTNHHVVETGGTDISANIEVKLNSNEKFTAKVIGFDSSTDLALLKIDATNLPYLSIGNSDELEIGDWVLAIGNPEKLTASVTAGIVSAKGRNINILENREYNIESFIQTDAVVNPGNSGGALVNSAGQLVGINTAILTHTGNYEGYSFAIPSNLVKKVVDDLKHYGKTQRAFLGVILDDIDNQKVKDLQLPNHNGVLIVKVYENSAGADGGLQPGDVILKIDQTPITNDNDLLEKIGTRRPGDEINIAFYRNGKNYTTMIKLKDINNETAIEPAAVRSDRILTDQGFEIRDFNAFEKRKFKINGVRVVGIYKGSTIDNCNMHTGYIITQINGQLVRDADDFIKKLKDLSGIIDLTGFYDFDESNSIYPYKFKKNP